MGAKPGPDPWKHVALTKPHGWKIIEVEAVPPAVMQGRWPPGSPGCPTGVGLQSLTAPKALCDLPGG
eukprot:6452077-Heterocapsa_arctica.AAC.1